MAGQAPEDLAKLGHRVIVLGRPEGRHAPAYPRLTEYAALQQAAIDELVGYLHNLIGHSFGGLLGQAHAILRPNSVAHLIIAGAPVYAPTWPGIPDHRALAALSSPQRSSGHIGLIYGGDFLDNPVLQDEYRPILEREIDEIEHFRLLTAALLSGELAVWKTWQLLWGPWLGLRMPQTLVMASPDDPIVPFAATERAARAIHASFVRVERGGHGFPLTRSRRFAETIHAFITDSLDGALCSAERQAQELAG